MNVVFWNGTQNSMSNVDLFPSGICKSIKTKPIDVNNILAITVLTNSFLNTILDFFFYCFERNGIEAVLLIFMRENFPLATYSCEKFEYHSSLWMGYNSPKNHFEYLSINLKKKDSLACSKISSRKQAICDLSL